MQPPANIINSIKNIPVFFIIGSPRSGTTMLRSIFDAHPNVNIPLEYPFILYLKNKYEHIKDWDKKILDEFYSDLQKPIKWDFWNIDRWNINKNEFLKGLHTFEGEHTFAEICKYVFYSFNSSFKKTKIKLLGDKNPSYSGFCKSLASIFPDAKFIYIIRDYHAQIDSLNHLDFGSRLTPLLALNWLSVQKKIHNELNNNKNNFYKIKYEYLVSNPESKVSEICQFLKIDYLPEILDYRKNKENLIQKHSSNEEVERYQANLFNPISESTVHKWKQTMPDKEVKIADMIVGKWAERFGYERKYKNVNPLLYIYILPIYAHRALQWFIGLFVKMLPHKTRNRIIYKRSIFEMVYEKIYVKLRGL